MEKRRDLGTSDFQSISEGTGFSGRERPLSPDAVLSTVENEYRRAILDVLTDASGNTLAYDLLVDRVADRVRDEDADRSAADHRRRVGIAVHHTHLPKLAAAQIINYEMQTGQVQFVGGELDEQIRRLLEPYTVHEGSD